MQIKTVQARERSACSGEYYASQLAPLSLHVSRRSLFRSAYVSGWRSGSDFIAGNAMAEGRLEAPEEFEPPVQYARQDIHREEPPELSARPPAEPIVKNVPNKR